MITLGRCWVVLTSRTSDQPDEYERVDQHHTGKEDWVHGEWPNEIGGEWRGVLRVSVRGQPEDDKQGYIHFTGLCLPSKWRGRSSQLRRRRVFGACVPAPLHLCDSVE